MTELRYTEHLDFDAIDEPPMVYVFDKVSGYYVARIYEQPIRDPEMEAGWRPGPFAFLVINIMNHSQVTKNFKWKE